ncbi:sensor histidine kinase, partial [Bacillus vallismortis]|nr:sensor histidine kinase [Bacillus vallismortis]
ILDRNGNILDRVIGTKIERNMMNQLELLKYSSKPWIYKREISVKILDKDRWIVATVPNHVYVTDQEYNKSFLKYVLKAMFL